MSKGFPYIAVSSKCIEDPGGLAKRYCRAGSEDNLVIRPGCDYNCSDCYIEVPYEEAGSIIIDSSGAIKCSFIIMWKGSEEYLLVERGVSAYIIEIEGHRVYGVASEGDKIARGDRIAYIATGKGEVRLVRSGFEGVVVYVAQKPESKPEKLLFIVIGGENVRRARILGDR